MNSRSAPVLSIVVPVFNEVESVPPLVAAVRAALQAWREDWELVFVDDGSRDGTVAAIDTCAAADDRVRLVRLARNYGQSAATQAGFDHARGSIIVTMDGDLQNDPADIPALITKLREGYDLVAGYRLRRQDLFLTRRLPSRVGNTILRVVTGIRLQDTGCTLKAFRRELVAELRLYSDLHRFIPVLAASVAGARIAEVPVRHAPRRFGQSKYGLSRVIQFMADLLTLAMLRRFEESPLRLFAIAGLIAFALSLAAGVTALAAAMGVHQMGSTVVMASAAACWLSLAGFLIMAGLIAEKFVHEGEDERFVGKILRRVGP